MFSLLLYLIWHTPMDGSLLVLYRRTVVNLELVCDLCKMYTNVYARTHARMHARTHTHTAYFLFLQQIQSLHQTTKDPENDGKRKDERVAVWLVFGAEGHLEGFKGGGWDRKTTHQTIHRVRCWSGLRSCKNRWMFSEYKTKMDSVV